MIETIRWCLHGTASATSAVSSALYRFSSESSPYTSSGQKPSHLFLGSIFPTPHVFLAYALPCHVLVVRHYPVNLK